MADFTPITTQEEFDERIKERLGRERKKIEEKYSDYDDIRSQLDTANGQIESLKTSHDEEVNGLNAKIKSYEMNDLRRKVAHEAGIPYELADRLTGDDEAAMKADAEMLAKHIAKNDFVPPMPDLDNGGKDKDDEDESYKKMLKKVRKTQGGE